MTTPAINALTAAGFKPPQVRYSKPDPRGPEYGRWSAEPFEVMAGEIHMEVSKHDGDKDTPANDDHVDIRYTMRMTLESFVKWAKDCT